MVKKVVLVVLVVAMALALVGGCVDEPKQPTSGSGPNPSQWTWYTTEGQGGEGMVDFEGYWEDPSVWDFGTLMPPVLPRAIEGDDSFYISLRGELEGHIVFSLNHWGMMKEGWKPRIVEVSNSEATVTIPQWDSYSPPGPGPLAITDCRRLDNGNYIVGKSKVGVFEVERVTGKVLRFMADSGTTHCIEQLSNGNILMNNPVTDMVYEKTWDGQVVWSWSVANHVQPYTMKNYYLWERSLGYRNMYYEWRMGSQWTQVNSVVRLPNGHHLLSLKNWDIIAEIDESGDIVWEYGALLLRKPHNPTLLDNGNILIHDTGNNRVIEVSRDQEIVWEYSEGMVSPMAGMAQRLDSGNTVILECFRSCIFEVTQDKKCVWEATAIAKPEWIKAQVPKTVTPGLLIFRSWWYPD